MLTEMLGKKKRLLKKCKGLWFLNHSFFLFLVRGVLTYLLKQNFTSYGRTLLICVNMENKKSNFFKYFFKKIVI